jgi:3-hydroxybutyryl-CoA dehydrogenase
MVISKVCVVGSGYLGTQIGVLSARHGYTVSMQDLSAEALSGSGKAVEGYIQEWIAEGSISEPEGEDIKGRMSYTVDLADAVKRAGLVTPLMYGISSLRRGACLDRR